MKTFPFKTRNPNEIAKELNLAAPVDVESVASALGVDVERKISLERMGHSGEVYISGGDPKVWVNPMESPRRQRFTLAHEIGHYVLHMEGHGQPECKFIDDVKTLRRSSEWDRKEFEANRFAASLLMPKHLVVSEGKKIVESKNISTIDQLIDVLADKFNVSNQAMKYRLLNLGIIKSEQVS